MTTKKRESAEIEPAIAATGFPEPSEKAKVMAALVLGPSVNAGAVVAAYTSVGGGDRELPSLEAELAEGIEELSAGEMKRAEAMLYGQAHALQAIFVDLARRATAQQYMKHWEAYLRMAMKAQNQCRMTLEALATIKNPPVVFARQANINNGGQQQVNNGHTAAASRDMTPGRADARAGQSTTLQNELLEAQHGNRLDARTAGTAGGADPHVEAVGAGHRAAQP